MKPSHLLWYRRLLALLAIIAALFFVQSPSGQRLNHAVLDAFTRWQVISDAPEDIVIIDIDDVSLQQVAPWPWPRDLMASLIERLFQQHHIKGLALDIVFPEQKDHAADTRLAEVVGRYDVCVAHAFDTQPAGRRIGHLAAPSPIKVQHPLQASGYVGNYAALAEAARCSGHITPHADQDGVVRRMPSGFRFGEQTWPWLAGALAAKTVPGPVDTRWQSIPFRHAQNAWQAVPAHVVLSGVLGAHALDGTWVLIGSTALGVNDAVVTPLANWTPGIVLHAELLDARLRPLPAPVPLLTFWPWLVSLLLVAGMLWALRRESLLKGAFVLLALNVLWLGLAYGLWRARVDFVVIAPLMTTTLLLVFLLPFEWRWVLRRHWRLARLFRGYLAPAVVERLLHADEGGQDVLRPQRREITVMFADIEGFTQLSREMPTDQLAHLTREVLGLLTEQVHRFEGTLDKYIGDAVMALWNAPLEQPDHADRAMQCALSMVQALEKWNGAHPEWPDIRIHVAINTGEAMVGDLGTSLRHTYTAIGHTVNQADRMLECARNAHRPIVVSYATSGKWKADYPFVRFCICEGDGDCIAPEAQQLKLTRL